MLVKFFGVFSKLVQFSEKLGYFMQESKEMVCYQLNFSKNRVGES